MAGGAVPNTAPPVSLTQAVNQDSMNRMTWQTRWAAILLIALDVAVLVAFALIPVVWLLHGVRGEWHGLHFRVTWGLRPIVAPVILLTVRWALATLFRKRGMPVRGWMETLTFKRVLLMVGSITILLLGSEKLLTMIGFHAELPPIVFLGKTASGGIERSDTIPDPMLLFRFKPGTTFAGRRINELGFREREAQAQKRPGAIRVICMGDSTTAQGRPGYSQYLDDMLTNRPPTPQSWEAFNMGTHGYTSMQGLVLFETQAQRLHPDIVIVSYGWNDQWLSHLTDRQQMGLEMRPWAGRMFDALRDFRFFQCMIWSLNPLFHLARVDQDMHARSKTQAIALHADPFEGYTFRVSPAEYRLVLHQFIHDVRDAGAIPVLMTEAMRRLPQEWADGRQYRSIEEGMELHEKYMDIMRDVARTHGCALLDLDAILAGKECDRYFAPDGVHYDFYYKEGAMKSDPPDQPGLRRVATEIDGFLRNLVRRDEWCLHRGALAPVERPGAVHADRPTATQTNIVPYRNT